MQNFAEDRMHEVFFWLENDKYRSENGPLV